MSKQSLEERVAALEQEIATLKSTMANGARPKDWRRTVGMFTGDKVMEEIFVEALKYRANDRERARRRFTRRARTKK